MPCNKHPITLQSTSGVVQRCEEPAISNISEPSVSSGPCPSAFWSSGSLFTFNSTSNALPDPMAADKICTPAPRKDVACDKDAAANKYCLHCSSGKSLACVAAGGQSCTSKNAKGALVFNLCTELGTTGAIDAASGCFASIKVGNSSYALQPNGRGAPLGVALSYSCPAPGES